MYVIPAISQLAVCVGSDSQWKTLNQAVMLKSRSEEMNVRVACLKIQREFYVKLGEEFLVLLPETIPFLAELMEDEEETVEKLCQEVCQVIQQYLGEDIQKYFN
jgi:hypothetical protein